MPFHVLDNEGGRGRGVPVVREPGLLQALHNGERIVQNLYLSSKVWCFLIAIIKDRCNIILYFLIDVLDFIVDNAPKAQTTLDEDILSVAVIGRPNAGKSSLLNYLASENRAIVSEMQGTTRDSKIGRAHV